MTAATQNKPPGLWRWLMKAQNPFMIWLLRSPFHGLVSRIYLLISVTGRKSGQTYTTPVQYAQDGKRLYIITSAGYRWWKNLRGGAAVQLHLRGNPVKGFAETDEDAVSVAALLQTIYPRMSGDQRSRFALGKVAIRITLDDEG